MAINMKSLILSSAKIIAIMCGFGVCNLVADEGFKPIFDAKRLKPTMFITLEDLLSRQVTAPLDSGWRGQKATFILNGEVVHEIYNLEKKVDGRWVSLDIGRIALQAEWAELMYRKIEIKEL